MTLLSCAERIFGSRCAPGWGSNQVVPFAAAVLLLFGLALGPDRRSLLPAAAGLFWIAVLLSAVLAIQRSFAVESADAGRDGLRLSGLDPAGIFLGKGAAVAAQLLVLEAVLTAGVAVLYGVPLGGGLVLAATCVLASAGLAAVGVVYGVVSSGLRVRETLLPLLFLPVAAPVLLAATKAWNAAISGRCVARLDLALAPGRLRRRLRGDRHGCLRSLVGGVVSAVRVSGQTTTADTPMEASKGRPGAPYVRRRAVQRSPSGSSGCWRSPASSPLAGSACSSRRKRSTSATSSGSCTSIPRWPGWPSSPTGSPSPRASLYLWPRTRDPRLDRLAGASAEVGVVFTGLTLVTGSIWGRTTWGVWWTWDPLLTTTALLFVLYLGYLALRRVPGDRETVAKRAAIAAVIAFFDVPIVYFSVSWWRSLHQPPTVDLAGRHLYVHGLMAWTLLLGFVSFTLAWVWLMIHRYRLATLRDRGGGRGPRGGHSPSAGPRGSGELRRRRLLRRPRRRSCL